jgi:mRNA interferase MazF
VARGDIFFVRLPVPSGQSGREQIGNRPAIVVQAEASDSGLPTTMIVPMTSSSRALRFPHTFQVDPSPQNGLTRSSILLVFQLRAIDKSRLGDHIGRLEQCHMQTLETEMRALLGI